MAGAPQQFYDRNEDLYRYLVKSGDTFSVFRRGLLGSLMDEEVFGFEVFHGMNCRCGPRSGQYGERAFDRLALRIVQTRAREVFHQWRAITYWWGVSLFPSL